MDTTRVKNLLLGASALISAGAIAAPAQAVMRTEKLGPNLCLTTGGGKFVPIPGFRGEKIDRRLLNDIKLLRRKYKIFVTDGYSNDPVHAANGEHPIGLAADIVPDTAAGGTWRDITALAKYAEPKQDQPIAPFRWVGYDGDAGHGRGNHLHLSWDHSDTSPGRPARSVYTLRCPGEPTGGGGGGTDGGGKGDGTRRGDTSGGFTPDDDGSGGYGVGRTLERMSFGGPIVVETGGVSER
jgi:hypothetical protein